jgi:hypothetical protein
VKEQFHPATLLPKLKDRFFRVGLLEGKRLLFGLDKKDLFDVAIVKVCAFDVRIYKTGIVKVGIIEGAIPDAAAVEIQMYQFRVFKGAVLEYASRKGKKLEIRLGEIAVDKGSKVEEGHPHERMGKQAHGKDRPVEVTAVEPAAGEISAFKTEGWGIEVLERFPL